MAFQNRPSHFPDCMVCSDRRGFLLFLDFMACIWFIELRTRTKVKWQQIVDQGLTSLHCNVILHCKHAVVSNTIVLIFSFGADSWLPSGDAVTFWPSVHPWCNQRL